MKIKYAYIILSSIFILSCNERYSPKPNGYLRIDLSPKNPQVFSLKNCPLTFKTSDYFNLIDQRNCWINLEYPEHNATIHITYKKVQNDIFKLTEN